MKRFLIILAIALLSATVLLAADKKALTYDDVIKLYRISDPQLSPDGKLIAYTATKYCYKTDSGNSDIWLVSIKGEEPERLTFHEGRDSSPRWSPDGKQLAFLSSRDGKTQIYIFDATRMGEPARATDIPTGVSSFKWSPTGEYFLFASTVFPECDDMKCNAEKLEQEKEEKVTAIVAEKLLYRHWSYWKAGKVSNLFSYRIKDGKITNLTPGKHWVPFSPFQGDEQYNASPDGKTVVFSSRTGDQPAENTNDDIYTVRIKGGESSQLTTAKGSDTTPQYSPDGKYISYIRMRRPGFEADRRELVLIDTKTKQHIPLTSGYDGDVLDYVWSMDNSTIYFTSSDHGRTGLYKVGLADKKVTCFYKTGVSGSLNISPDNKYLVCTWQTSTLPAEILGYRLKMNNPVQITSMNNDVLSDIEMNPVEDIHFRASGGDVIHGFMIKPPFFDKSKKYPMIYLIHGGPQGAWQDRFHYRWNYQLFAAGGYVIAAVNFHGSSGYGQKFRDAVTYDWGGKPYRDLMKGIEHLTNKYSFIDSRRIGAAGASYGGYMINWIAGHTDRFNCLVSHAGVYNLVSMYGATEELWFPEWEYRGTPWSNPKHYREMSPSSYVENFKTPTLVIHGQKDFRVPVTQGMEFFTALQKQNVPSKLIYFPDEGHFVGKPNNARFWYKQVLGWMDKYLK